MDLNEYIEHYTALYEGKPWYGPSIKKALDNIFTENINKSLPGGNSLGQILEHMIAWRSFTLEMLKKNEAFRIDIDSLLDWNKEKIYSKEEWTDMLSELDKNQKALVEMLKDAPEGLGSETVPGRKFNFAFLLDGIVQHDIYHLGQISMLNKL